MITKNDLYGWIFTYNPETGNWRACERDDYLKFFSEPESKFIRSNDVEVLQEVIMRELHKQHS